MTIAEMIDALCNATIKIYNSNAEIRVAISTKMWSNLIFHFSYSVTRSTHNELLTLQFVVPTRPASPPFGFAAPGPVVMISPSESSTVLK